MKTKLVGIVLAGGKSTRFEGGNKVLVDYHGKPIIRHVVDCMTPFTDSIIIVVNSQSRVDLEAALKGTGCSYAVQQEALGTANALLTGIASIPNFAAYDSVLVTPADKPLVIPATFKRLISEHQSAGNYLTIATSHPEDPKAKGRILRDAHGGVSGIVEFRNCTRPQRETQEVNTGYLICKTSGLIDLLNQIKRNSITHEFYLTDLAGLCYKQGLKVGSVEISPEEAYDINTAKELNDIAVVGK